MTTTTTEAGLLAAILADPDDDTPRLVYADWLDENAGSVPCACARMGHIGREYERAGPDSRWVACEKCRGSGVVPDGHTARAEFIRVQCELTRLDESGEAAIHDEDGHTCCEYPCPVCAAVTKYATLRRRERDLWTLTNAQTWGLGERWRHTLHEHTMAADYGASTPAALFRRGFIDSVTATATDFLATADSLVWHPKQTERCRTGHLFYGKCVVPSDPNRGLTGGAKACPHCSGTGRVPRRMPATAQPVTKVTLTTNFTGEVGHFNQLRQWKKPLEWGLAFDNRDCIRAEWDWIKFDWPTGTTE